MRLLALLLASVFATSCDGNLRFSVRDEVQAHAELGAAIRAVQDANNAGDVDAWVALFDEEFRYLPPNAPAVTNRDSLRAMAEAGFSAWRAEVLIRPVETNVVGEWAIVDTEVRGRATGRASADTILVDLKELVVFRRTPVGWRIVRLMLNPNA